MKIFIINLSRSQHRKQAMQQQIAMLNNADLLFEFHFFNAIDGQAAEHQQFARHYHPLLAKIYRGTDLTDGEKACYASHFCLWKKCITLNEPIVIMEDDVKFSTELTAGLIRIANSHYDYVKIITTKKNKILKSYLNENFYIAWKGITGARGYYITPTAAQKFVHTLNYWTLPVDDYMDRICMHGVKTIVHIPELLQGNIETEDSTINVADNRPTIPFFWKVVREVCRIFQQINVLWYIMRNK